MRELPSKKSLSSINGYINLGKPKMLKLVNVH
jgi:hypothetical protein